MRKFAALGATAVLGLAGQAFAADGFSYNLVEASFVHSEFDGANMDGNGLGLAGSVAFHPNFHGFASYKKADLDGGFDLSQTSVGVGFNWAINPSLDLVSGLSYERVQFGGSEDGYGLGVGLRGRAGERLELTGNLKYVDLGHGADDVVFSAGGRYYFTDALAAGLDFSKYDDSDLTSWQLVVRYDFGRR